MAKQLFSKGLLKMAGIPLEEEPRKILEPRRIEDREEKRKQEEYKRLVELFKQTGGKIKDLSLSRTPLTELPEGIISVKRLYLFGSKIQKLPNSLKKVGRLELTQSKIEKLPEDLEIYELYAGNCESLKRVPSYKRLRFAVFEDSSVEEIGEYPELEWLVCTRSSFLEEAEQEAEAQKIDIRDYIRQKHKLPQSCKVYL